MQKLNRIKEICICHADRLSNTSTLHSIIVENDDLRSHDLFTIRTQKLFKDILPYLIRSSDSHCTLQIPC